MMSIAGSRNISTITAQWAEIALISIGVMYLSFAGIKCLAAERSSDQTIERTQLQLEYLADIAHSAASKTAGKKVDLIHIIRVPDFTDKNNASYSLDALRKIGWYEEYLVNQWGGRINVLGENGKLIIEYEGAPDEVCSSKLFDYARKNYEFRCNEKRHQTKIVGAIQQQPVLRSSQA